jgi:hypothetical protein
MIAHAPNFASRRVEILEDRCQVGMHPLTGRSSSGSRCLVLNTRWMYNFDSDWGMDLDWRAPSGRRH